ncbi:MAG: glycoside hydrolase family 3 N-terminal domain-containing protein [Terracidiphilus sp.]
MKPNLRHAVGSLLVVGLSGTELTALERAWLKLVRPAGVILFRRNISDAQQTRSLLNESTALCEPHSFRSVDVEGGTVDRLRDALAPMPSAQAVASAARAAVPRFQKRDLHTTDEGLSMGTPELGHTTGLAREHGELIARAVKAFGFNTTLAPVLDLALPVSASVLGTRAAGATAQEVIDYARGFLGGLAAQNVAGCGKHFPGLGGGSLDSHVETPAIHRGMRALQREDLAPYRALRNELPMVMVNHAAYPNTPGKNTPASASHYWITTVLRKRIGYRGIIFSDDLEMGGILKFMSIEEATISAIRAGMSVVEICHTPELILRAYESLLAEAEHSAAFSKLLLARAQQTALQRAKLFASGVPPALTGKQFEALRERILRFTETIQEAQTA